MKKKNPNPSDALHKAKAQQMWLHMDMGKRVGIRLGLFPHDDMQSAETEGFDGTVLVGKLMEVAQENGGMIA